MMVSRKAKIGSESEHMFAYVTKSHRTRFWSLLLIRRSHMSFLSGRYVNAVVKVSGLVGKVLHDGGCARSLVYVPFIYKNERFH